MSLNHRTLADFRVSHGAVLEQLLVDSFAALLKSGIASLDRVAQDGVRVRASAGAASLRRRSTLKVCHRAAKAHVERLRSEIDADPSALSRREAAARERAGAGRRKRDGKASGGAAKPAPPDAGQGPAAVEPGQVRPTDPPTAERGAPDASAREPRASTTDAEARVMKRADGG